MLIRRIGRLAAEAALLDDAALRERMQALRGAPAGKPVAEAFALVAEAFRRVMGIAIHPEQLEGAAAMAKGKIARLETGEGKTFTAAFPACLYALTGSSVCIATVNPYLAARDREWLEPVYAMLGFSTGLVAAGQEREEKRTAYAADITYGTHSEFGFDYLRDNLVRDPSETVQREPYFMLVDEADSILLDEAVTPMLLSGQGVRQDPRIYPVDRLIPWLKSTSVQTLDEENYAELDAAYDYIVLQKERVAILTSLGAKHAAQFFPKEDFDTDVALQHLLYQALQAHGTLKRDVDYIVSEGKLKIVDRNTGRIAAGRRFCDGLWQALQVKEGLELNEESRTLAAISYQQFFRRYPLLCGMTGTAWEDRAEFSSVYGLSVKRIRPHKRSRRKDLPDLFAKTAEEAAELAVREIESNRAAGRPCLVAARSVEDSERFGALLTEAGIPCRVLNAKKPAEEAEIIREAGTHGNVTVATAMAGRGTDIRLDREALEAGGLFVLGLSHQDTRRGDRQLRGRAGRQGEPGSTRFLVCAGDELIRRFTEGDPPETEKECKKRIRLAQRLAEGNAQAQREGTAKLDEAIAACRDGFYAERRNVLNGEVPERYRTKPQALVRETVLSAMDGGWSDFLGEANRLKQNCGAVSMTGHDAKRSFQKDITRLFDEIFAGVREELDRRIGSMPETAGETGTGEKTENETP
ncbi:MAG: preprotein translocase subunit SecA [Clostridia bacterium]|nr:preprotein translocase subunit SecA [Clostridia bacterium]